MSTPAPQASYPSMNAESNVITHTDPVSLYLHFELNFSRFLTFRRSLMASFPVERFSCEALCPIRRRASASTSTFVAAYWRRATIATTRRFISTRDLAPTLACEFFYAIKRTLRFSSGEFDIVLNSLVNNKWGTEQRHRNTMELGQPFTVRILVLQDYFKV